MLVYTLLGFFFGPPILDLLERVEIPLELLASAGLLAALLFWTVRVGRRAEAPERRPELRERVQAGAASGLMATLASALLANVLIHLLGLLAFGAPAAGLGQLLGLLSEQIGRAPGLAAAVLLLPAFLVVGAGLGAAYGACLGNASYSAGPLRGAAFALLPLAGSLLVILPMVGAGPAGSGFGTGPIPALGETIPHLAYGLVLGTLYPALARP